MQLYWHCLVIANVFIATGNSENMSTHLMCAGMWLFLGILLAAVTYKENG